MAKDEERCNAKIEKLLNTLPRMKVYPREPPTAVDMVLNWSIYPDLKIYSTFLNPIVKDPILKSDLAKGKIEVPRVPLHFIKPNTLLTVSLECERVLKHIYIDIEELKLQLKTKGHYEPPGIVFRYWGVIYFKIRNNLPMRTEWIENYKKKKVKYVT